MAAILFSAVFPCKAEWSITEFPSQAIDPDSSFGAGGECEENVAFTVQIDEYEPGEGFDFLCSHALIQEAGTGWFQDFVPEDAPGNAWPVTQPGDGYLRIQISSSQTAHDWEYFECEEEEL